MTMHADQLLGAPVIDSEGQAVGTVFQVFRDDVDGTPSWARIRSGADLRFVPLAGSSLTGGGGLSVPFSSQKIMQEPDVNVDQHMSVTQEEELRHYFGLSAAAQEQSYEPYETYESYGTVDQPQLVSQTEQAQPAEPQPAEAQAAEPQAAEAQAAEPQAAEAQAAEAQEWLVASEERISVNLETRATGKVTLRKYIDTEPVRQTIRVFHEEYEVEHLPVTENDLISDDMTEHEQQVTLHEARAVITKHAVPVERVRLSVRRVEEDKTVSDQLRRERIEVVSDAEEHTSPPRGYEESGGER